MRLKIIGLAVLLLAGCANNSSGISIDSSNQQVVLTHSELAHKLEFGSAKEKRVNGRLNAAVKVTNISNQTQKLQYRFDWYDVQGLEIDAAQAPWQPFELYGGQVRTLQGVAVNPEAEKFRISIRKLNN